MASRLSSVPSARFCWQHLARDLAPVGGELALDVACGAFANRHLFHTRTYYGLDLFPAQLQAGLDRYADDNSSIGVVADIGRPLPFMACADVCVSTYTLLYVPPAQRLTVTQQLVDSVRRGGCLILQCPNVSGVDAILSRLRAQFRRLEVTYFHSPLSRYYSRRRSRHRGHIRMTTPATPSVWTPLWTFVAERLFPNVPWGNADIYIRAEDKCNGETLPCSMQELIRQGDRLYRSRTTPELRSHVLADASAEADMVQTTVVDAIQQGLAPEAVGIFTTTAPMAQTLLTHLAPSLPVHLNDPWIPQSPRPGYVTLACWPARLDTTFDMVVFVGAEQAALRSRPPIPYLLFELVQATRHHLVITAVRQRQGASQTPAAFVDTVVSQESC